MAENIATKMRDDQDHLTAWKTILSRTVRPEKLAILQGEVESEISRLRADSSYVEHLDQVQKAIDNAATDDALISVLHSEGLGRMEVGTL